MLGHQELSINHSTNLVPYGAWRLLRLPLIGDNDTVRSFSLRGNLGQNHLRTASEPIGGVAALPQTSCNQRKRSLASLSAQRKRPSLMAGHCCLPLRVFPLLVGAIQRAQSSWSCPGEE